MWSHSALLVPSNTTSQPLAFCSFRRSAAFGNADSTALSKGELLTTSGMTAKTGMSKVYQRVGTFCLSKFINEHSSFAA
jgi:hypothetical protein